MSIINALMVRGRQSEMAADEEEETKQKPADLAKQWESFTKPADLIAKINQGYALLGSIFAHNTFFDSAGRSRTMRATEQADVGAMAIKAGKEAQIPNKIGETNDSILMQVLLPPLRCWVGGVPAQPTGGQAKAREMSVKILEGMFPGMEFAKLPVSDGHVTAAIPPCKMPLEALKSFGGIPDIGTLNFDDWPKEYRNVATFELQPFDVMVGTSSISDHITNNTDVHFSIGVTVNLKLPKEYAYWSTDSDKTDFTLLSFLSQFKKRYSYYCTPKPETTEPTPVSKNPGKVDSVIKKAAEYYGIAPKVQTNAEGICSLPNGRMIWVPEQSSLNVAGVFNSCVVPLKQGDPSETLREVDFAPLMSRHIGTNWLANKMMITDASANFKLVDLNGARSPSPAALAHFMKQPVGEEIIALSAICARLEDPIPWTDLKAGGIDIDIIVEGDIAWENLMDVPYIVGTDDEKVNPTTLACFKLGKHLADAYTRLVASNLPVYEQYQVRPYLALFGVYAKNRLKYAEELKEQSALNRMHVDSDQPPPLKDLTGVSGFMPHQVRVTNELSVAPSGAILDVKAGGGKCLVGSTSVYTSQGMFSLKELWNLGGEFIEGGIKKLHDVQVYTTDGLKKAVGIYRTEGSLTSVTLSDGTKITGLPEHRMYTWGSKDFKFTRLDQLEDAYLPKYYPNLWSKKCARLEKVEFYNGNSGRFYQPKIMDNRIAGLMGWLVSEGTNNNRNIRVTQFNKEVLKSIKLDFMDVFRLNSDEMSIKDNTLCISRKHLGDWFEANGVVRGRSNKQQVPWSILQSPKSVIVSFLQTLFQGDGSIYSGWSDSSKGHRWHLEYYSASPILAKQVKSLLENFGIRTSIRRKKEYRENIWGDKNRYSKVKVEFYSIPKFAELIGFACDDKNKLLAEASEHILSGKKQNTNEFSQGYHNKMPCEKEYQLLKSRMENAFIGVRSSSIGHNQMGWNTLKKLSGYGLDNNESVTVGKGKRLYGITRHSLHKILTIYKMGPIEWREKLKNDKMAQYAIKRIHLAMKYEWLKVVSVKMLGISRYVYDLVVPGPQNYAFSGVLGHNTVSMIYDITNLVAQGKIKRPCVMMPRNLLPQFAKEIIKFTNGHFKPFILSNVSWRGLRYSGGKGWSANYRNEEMDASISSITALIKNQPPNTIILVDYNWLAQGRVDIEVMGESSPFYPHAALLDRIGVDYVAADECFPGTTHVLIDYDKSAPIEDVYNNKDITHVLSYDLKKRKIVKRKIVNRFRTSFKDGKDSWINIRVRDHQNNKLSTFRCTPNHQIFLSDGTEISAGNLKVGDQLITFDGKFDKYRNAPDNTLVKCGLEFQKKFQQLDPVGDRIYPCKYNCGFKGKPTEILHHLIEVHGELQEFVKKRAVLSRKNIIKNCHTGEAREKHLDRMNHNNPMLDPEVRSRSGEGVSAAFWAKPKRLRDKQVSRFINAPFYDSRKANKIEQRVIDAGIENLKFTGDGSYFVRLDIDGVLRRKNKNPDFIYAPERCGTCKNFSNCKAEGLRIRTNSQSCQEYKLSSSYRTNKVVEVMDFSYWHSKDEIKPLKKAYAKAGIKCLILDAAKPITEMRGKIESHINNHYVTVERIQKNGLLCEDKYKYDLEVEGNHNYFIVAGTYSAKASHASNLDKNYQNLVPILVHNSQRIKAEDAGRAKASAIVFANAKYRRLSSGTIIHNVTKDLVGQMAAIEPLALGAIGTHLREGGSVIDPVLKKRMLDNMTAFSRKIQVPRREWAHLLPERRENIYSVPMTDNQQKFNNKVMEKAFADLANDPKLRKLEKMDPEKAQKKIETLLSRYFAKLEIWINAPDSQSDNAYGLAFTDMEGITEEDLKSSKIDQIDHLIEQHINGHTFNGSKGAEEILPDPCKIIVASYNKDVSVHIFKHSKFAHLGIHYTAGDDAAMAAFESDKEGTPKILYCDFGGITEGKNLQLASRLILCQSPWAPGTKEQLVARIWRPDVPDKDGKIKYPRKYVWLDHIMCLDGETLISTKERGVVSIASLDDGSGKIQKLEVTIPSRFKKEKTCLWLNKGLKETFTVKTDDGFEICGTANHRILRVDPSTLEQSWVEIGNLMPGDILCVSKNEVIRKTKLKLDVEEYPVLKHSTKNIALPRYMEEKLAWCLGFFNAEGCYPSYKSGKCCALRVCNNDKRMVDRWCEYMKSIFGVDYKILSSKLPNGLHHYRGQINSVRVCHFFKEVGMSDMYFDPKGRKPSHYKVVPWSIMQSDGKSQLAYFAGFVDGDGHVGNYITASSRSKNLIQPLQQILLSHGIVSRFACRKAGLINQYYVTVASTHDAEKLAKKLEPYLVKNADDIIGAPTRSRCQGIKHKLVPIIRDRFVERRGNWNNTTKINSMFTVYRNDSNELVSMEKGEGAYLSGIIRDNKYLPTSVKNNKKFTKALEKISSSIAENLKHLSQCYHYVTIDCIVSSGKKQVYDLTMCEGADPSFAANGIIVHNCSPSIEVPKQARLIGKQVENLLIDESDDKNLQNIVEANPIVFQKIRRIAMSLKFIKDNGLESATTGGIPNIVADQIQAYKLTKRWEEDSFTESREKLVNDIMRRTGKKIDKNNLAALSMIPVKSEITPAFVPSKSLQSLGFMPWVEGFPGFNPTSLHLLPLAIPTPVDEDSEDESSDEDMEEGAHVEVGDPIVTQYGLGWVIRLKKVFVEVSVPGFHPSAMSIRRYLVLGGKEEVDKEVLRKLLKNAGKAGVPTVRVDAQHNLIPINNKIPEEHIVTTIKAIEREVQNKKDGIKGDRVIRTRGGKPIGGEPTKVIPKKSPYLEDEEPDVDIAPIIKRGPKNITKAPGVEKTDPFINKNPVIQKPMTIAPTTQRPVTPKVTVPVKKPKGVSPISLTDIDEDSLWSEREGEVVIFNGVLCILTPGGEDSDDVLVKNGFDRIGGSVTIQVKNPKGYRALVELLSKEFVIPRANKRALDQFGDIYDVRKQNIAYTKNKELPFHRQWLLDQHKKSADKKEIRPWPVVEDGIPRLYINRETCPAANRLKTLQMPLGVGKKTALNPALIGMVKNTMEAKTLLRELEAKHVRFLNKKQLIVDLARTK